MFDGDWVAGYLYKLAERANKLGEHLESGGTYQNTSDFEPEDKRIIRLAISRHIAEQSEVITNKFLAIPGDLKDGYTHHMEAIHTEMAYLLKVLKNFE